MREITNARLFRILQRWVGESYPGDEATRIAIRLRSGDVLKLKVPTAFAVQQPAASKPGDRKHSRKYPVSPGYIKRVYQVVPEHNEEGATARKIARLAKVSYHSYFRLALKSLLVEGRIERHEGRYRKTNAEA